VKSIIKTTQMPGLLQASTSLFLFYTTHRRKGAIGRHRGGYSEVAIRK